MEAIFGSAEPAEPIQLSARHVGEYLRHWFLLTSLLGSPLGLSIIWNIQPSTVNFEGVMIVRKSKKG